MDINLDFYLQEVKGMMSMKKRKNAKKRLFQIVGTIGIASVFLAIVLIIVGNFTKNEKENISKADNYSEVKIGLTNFGGTRELTGKCLV